jgi:allantoinase
MSPARFALASSRIVTPQGVRGGAVLVNGEKIEAVLSRDDVPTGVPVDDLDGLVISPGVVDTHVHINEPGRTEWEGFETATRAAAAGGVTTLIDMPLNSSPVTTTVAALDAKRKAAEGKCSVDVGFHGGLVPGNLKHIEPLIDAGVCGVKAFLCDSGLDEFPASGDPELRAALPVLARRGVPLLVHAELIPLPRREGQGEGLASRSELEEPISAEPIRSYNDWLASRPEEFERNAVALLRQLCAEYRAPIHVVHLASGPLTSHFFWAKQDGLPLTVETCPHYLHFYAERLAEADTRFKCAPPIRRKEDRTRLWEALIEGVIDTIGSDHSPCPPEMKLLGDNAASGSDWQRVWGGVSSVELTLPIVWRGCRTHMITFNRLAQWLSENPARLVGLDHRKGRIAAGYDADLCIWNHQEEWTVRGEDLQHRHKLTPYEGERLRGRVKRTYVRGHLVYNEGAFPVGLIGQLLRRPNE